MTKKNIGERISKILRKGRPKSKTKKNFSLIGRMWKKEW